MSIESKHEEQATYISLYPSLSASLSDLQAVRALMSTESARRGRPTYLDIILYVYMRRV